MAATTAMILGAASMASSAAGGAMSFLQASKQAKLQRQAEADAKKALEEAKRQINVNPYAALGIQKEPYELERQALLSQGAQGIQAAQEADRGAAAAVGRVQMAQTEAQAGQRAAMQKEMSDLEKLTAEEQANIKSDLAGVALQEAQGYEAQAKEARDARAKNIAQGYQSAQNFAQTGIETFMPLYLKQRGINPETGERFAVNQRKAERNMAQIGMPTVMPSPQGVVGGALSPMGIQRAQQLGQPSMTMPSETLVEGATNPLMYQYFQQNPFVL